MQNQPIHALYIDDSPAEYQMIRDFLEIADPVGFKLDWASSYETALEWMTRDEHDIYLIDHNLGHHTGIELLREAVARGSRKPMIMITGHGDRRTDIAAMEAGAADYLEKTEVKPSILERAIRNAVERARAFAALRASEERYRELFETTTDLIQGSYADGRIEYANRAWRQTIGYSEDEITGLTLADIIHPDYYDDYMAIRSAVLAEGKPRSVETVFRSKDGKLVNVEGTITCRFAGDKPVATHAIFRDITARKRDEQVLRYQATLLENVSDAVIAADPNFNNIHIWNAAAEKMYGWTAEEVLGKNTTNLLQTEFDGETREEAVKNLFEKGFWSTEITQKRKDGVVIQVHSSVTLIRDSQGNPISLVGVNRDITERKLAEHALRESERRFRGLFERTNDAVFIINFEGCHIATNQRAADMLGYTVDELIGMSIENVVVPREFDDSRKVLHSLNSGAPPPSLYEKTFRRKDGTEFPVEINVEMVKDADGNPMHIQSVVRDITERKRAEQIEYEQRTLLEALLNVAAILSSTLDFNEVLDLILANVEQVVPHDTASVMLIDNGVARIVRSLGYDRYHAELMADSTFVVEKTPTLKYMYETQLPMIVGDVHASPDWKPTEESRWIRSYAAVPISLEGEVIGFLNLDSTTPNFFTPVLLDRLQAFSHQIGIAVRNARHYDEAKQFAAANERQRLANDLHDAVSQTLFSASLIAETLPRLWNNIPPDLNEGLIELHHLTRQALAEMRALLLELRPTAIEETDIEELLAQLIETFSRRERINTNFMIGGRCELPPDTKVVFYRVAQEALNNIGKHARATQVEMSLKRHVNEVELYICDNGHGFDPGTVPANHFGVKIMHERAASVGARLNLNSQLEQGTKITLTWVSN